MAVYAYRARDAGGHLIEGSLTAPDEREAVRQLRERGLMPTHLAVATAPAATAEPARAFPTLAGLFRRKVKLKSLALVSRQLSTMIGAGLSILISLRTIAEQSGEGTLRDLLNKVADRLEAGEALSDAFRHHVPTIPPLMVYMIEAGEASGILEEVFTRLAQQFEREHALNEKVKSATLYPKIVLAGAGLMMIFLFTNILPTFVGLFASLNVELPAVTRGVLNFGEFVRTHLVIILLGLVALYAGFRALARTKTGRDWIDALSLKIPVLGELYLKRSMARFTRTLATLLSSGLPILTALRVAERTLDNAVLERSVQAARENVRAGRSLSRPLRDDGLFPRMLVELTAVGEETGALDNMLFKAAEFYEQETAATVERLTSLLEPALILGTAGVVGTIIASVFLPLYQLLGSVQ